MRALTPLLIFACGFLASCNGKVLNGGTDDPGLDGGALPGNPGQVDDAAVAVDPRCGPATALDPQPATRTEFAKRLVGTWRRCGPVARGIPQFESFVVTEDGPSLHWAALRGGDGSERPSTSDSERGTCSVTPPSSVLFGYRNGAQWNVVLLFESGGARLRVVQNGFDPANIVYFRTAP
jgi:hypothetical protein